MNKKKIFIGIFAVAIVTLIVVNMSLSGLTLNDSKKIMMRLSEVEAYASEAGGEIQPIKRYAPITSDCPPPVEYKKSVSCPFGSTASECYSSDC